MALNKVIELENGSTAEYWKIISPELTSISINGYISKEKREENISLSTAHIQIKIELTEEERESYYKFLYNLVKTKNDEFKDAEDLL